MIEKKKTGGKAFSTLMMSMADGLMRQDTDNGRTGQRDGRRFYNAVDETAPLSRAMGDE
jgi:hypothetical protein